MKVLLELSPREAMERIADGRLEAFLEGEAHAEAVVEKGARKATKAKPAPVEAPPVAEAPPAEIPVEKAPVVETPAEPVSLEELRALCGPISQKSEAHKAALKEALTAVGASNLSGIPEDRRAEFRDKALEIDRIEVKN